MMEDQVENLIEHLYDKRKQELKNIEYLKQSDNKQSDIKDIILITSGKILELDVIIQNLHEMLAYQMKMKSEKK
jgi:hypothetical protein